MNDDLKKIDCFGDICPVPVLKAEEAIKHLSAGQGFVLVTDHSCVVESVKEKYRKRNIKIDIKEVMNGVWEITFSKP